MRRASASAILLVTLLCTAVSAATVGQIDTFTAGTQGWFAGGGPFGQVPPIPPHVELGGPGGSADPFLLITANTASNAGSKVVANNASQWAGNYLAPGISGIALDLKNFGSTDLTIRLLFEDPQMGPPANEAVSNTGIFLPAGSGWIHAFIPIGLASFTALDGSVAGALSGATFMRIINATSIGDAETAIGVLGVDNIQAIPEPRNVFLIGIALALLARRNNNRVARRGLSSSETLTKLLHE